MNLKPSFLLGAIASTTISLASVLPAVALPASLTASTADSYINVRTSPTTQSRVSSYGLVGDRVETLRSSRGQDGYTWYYIRFNNSRVEGWVRGDLLRIESATRPTPAPMPTPSPAPVQTPPRSPAPMPTPTPSPVRPPTPSREVPPQPVPTIDSITQEHLNYFLEVAMGSEWGSNQAVLRKWSGDVRIKYFGSPTDSDLATLQAVVSELDNLTGDNLRVQVVDRNPNIEVYFVPEAQFTRYEPNYVSRNLGFFWTWWNANETINRARVLITTDGVTQSERSHLIREELTQSLGLMRDSQRYRDSIFYQGWTSTTQYSEIDRAIIALLYQPELRTGMTRSQVAQVLGELRVASEQGAVRHPLTDLGSVLSTRVEQFQRNILTWI